jgi:protein-tyrosine-phosphatase
MRTAVIDAEHAWSFLSLLGHPQRWRLVEALVRSDRRVQELVEVVDAPSNLVSYHLRKLRERELVHERRSSADARDVYYTLDLGRLRSLYQATAEAIHPGIVDSPERGSEAAARPAKRVRVLFLCTHNSARSQMAEAVLRSLGGDRFSVQSAGTEPTSVHPLAARVMASRGIDLASHRSKPMADFVGQRFDYVITVCDVAREHCPAFPGDPDRIHWSIPDPAAVEGAEAQRLQAFEKTANDLTTRIRFFLGVVDRSARGTDPRARRGR